MRTDDKRQTTDDRRQTTDDRRQTHTWKLYILIQYLLIIKVRSLHATAPRGNIGHQRRAAIVRYFGLDP